MPDHPTDRPKTVSIRVNDSGDAHLQLKSWTMLPPLSHKEGKRTLYLVPWESSGPNGYLFEGYPHDLEQLAREILRVVSESQ